MRLELRLQSRGGCLKFGVKPIHVLSKPQKYMHNMRAEAHYFAACAMTISHTLAIPGLALFLFIFIFWLVAVGSVNRWMASPKCGDPGGHATDGLWEIQVSLSVCKVWVWVVYTSPLKNLIPFTFSRSAKNTKAKPSPADSSSHPSPLHSDATVNFRISFPYYYPRMKWFRSSQITIMYASVRGSIVWSA